MDYFGNNTKATQKSVLKAEGGIGVHLIHHPPPSPATPP
jgi:hypothetical protein